MNINHLMLVVALVCGVGIGMTFVVPDRNDTRSNETAASSPPSPLAVVVAPDSARPIEQRPSLPSVARSEPFSIITVSSRNSPNLLVESKHVETRQLILAHCIAFRREWGNDDKWHDTPGAWMRFRLVIENYLLNMCPLDQEGLDELIKKSGCNPDWSARQIQQHINGYVVRVNKDPAGEAAAQECIGRYGFGWLGEPGDKSLDIFRTYMGLSSSETLADTARGIVPGDFKIGGIPLSPRQHPMGRAATGGARETGNIE